MGLNFLRQGKDGEDDDILLDTPVSVLPQAGPAELDVDGEAAHSQAEDHPDMRIVAGTAGTPEEPTG